MYSSHAVGTQDENTGLGGGIVKFTSRKSF